MSDNTQEALERAARAIFEHQWHDDWNQTSSEAQDTWRDIARVALEAAAPHGDLDAMLNEHVSAGGTATFEREVVTWHAWVDDDRLQGSGYGPTAAVADAVARARKETTNATN